MTVLVLGATGATGSHVARYLLGRGHAVKVIVRSRTRLSADIASHDKLQVIEASVLDLSQAEVAGIVHDCEAVVSCLGHTMNFKGLYGRPRKLVTDTAKLVCAAITQNGSTAPTKYILMNTAGNSNRDLAEPISFGQKCIIATLRLLLPPHVDNEAAADFLRTEIGQDNRDVEWSVVRPDSLVDHDEKTPYEVHPSPTRSALFDPGNTSRINVAHFMGALAEDADLWTTWKGRMPVIYNVA